MNPSHCQAMEVVVEGSLMVVENTVPDHFLDEDFMDVRTNKLHPGVFKHFYPSLGLLLKIRRGARHCCQSSKRNRAFGRDVLADTPALLWKLWNYFVWPGSFDSEKWDPDLLFALSDELRQKGPFINGFLESCLGQHVLLPTTAERGIIFDPQFLRLVVSYHDELERPAGTFEVVEADAASAQQALEERLRLPELEGLARDVCRSCNCRKQVYCGDCTGVRMANAEALLPERITLPFDVLLLIDWHETLHKCTGVHAATLSAEGTVTVQRWRKCDRPEDHEDIEAVAGSGWAEVVKTFDHERDVILFPGEGSINIQDLDWRQGDAWRGQQQQQQQQQHPEEEEEEEGRVSEQLQHLSVSQPCAAKPSPCSVTAPAGERRYRLILIESTWNGAKNIVNQVQRVRAVLLLPPLRLVALPESVNGLYWKLQHVGSSAVSTIEALAHAARAAGCMSSEADKLLTLFFLQRRRLLSRIQQDGRPPRAVDVRGPWRRCYEELLHSKHTSTCSL